MFLFKEEPADVRVPNRNDLNTEHMFRTGTEEELFLLEYKYFRRRRVLRERFAACRPDWSERTYYRRQNAVLRKFAAALAAQGWPERAYFSAFSSFPPFSRVYDAISAGREGAVVGKRSRGERGAP